VQRPIPAYVGSFSQPSIELAARLGCNLIVAPFAAAMTFGGLRQVGELYRELSAQGAEVITVPAAFTLATTRDHWEVLIRARAIENQCFVIAPNQIGTHAPGIRSGGRSLIVDPWGLVLATAPDCEAAIVADAVRVRPAA